MRRLLPHAGFMALLAAAAPLAIAFAWQRGIATLGDDSVSYVVLARHFVPGGDALSDPWVAGPGHFPPLFPLVLAACGAAHNLLVAHVVVALLALAALAALYAYATHELRDARLGLALAAAFLLTPDAWICIKGILSEPLYLLLSLCALHYQSMRLQERAARVRSWLAFGVLLACCYLARAAAIALIAAYAVHVGVRIAVHRERPAAPLLAACLPVVLLVGFWLAWRPSGPSDAY